jgi:hypothetical protein
MTMKLAYAYRVKGYETGDGGYRMVMSVKSGSGWR